MYEMMIKLKDGNDMGGMEKLFNDPEIQKKMEAQAGGMGMGQDMAGMGNMNFDSMSDQLKDIEMPSGDQMKELMDKLPKDVEGFKKMALERNGKEATAEEIKEFEELLVQMKSFDFAEMDQIKEQHELHKY